MPPILNSNTAQLVTSFALILGAFLGFGSSCPAAEDVQLDLTNYQPTCGVEIQQDGPLIHVSWRSGAERRIRLTFDLNAERPLVRTLASATGAESFRTIAEHLDPVLLLRVGKRDLDKRGGWTIFFDRMQRKPSQLFRAEITRKRATAASDAQRATLTIGDVSAGPFHGQLRWTFYAGNPFVLQEAVLQTERRDAAFLFDCGLVCNESLPARIAWRDSRGSPRRASPDAKAPVQRLAVRGRAVGADYGNGSITLFPPPHRYFYPLDFSDNLKNIWMGANYGDQQLPFGFGIRHDPQGDNRFVPWFNAPPGTNQELGVFLYFSDKPAERALEEAARLTRNDRFESLPGHSVFSSHYHVEHTREVLTAQDQPPESADESGKLPGGGAYRIPKRLVNPGFMKTFRKQGVDIVHLAEFHFGRTPRMSQSERLRRLELLHAECKRLSDKGFLLLPGEEPNVHLGGHWLSFFPKPVYWVLNRPDGVPFVKDHPQLGRVYHVGGEADVLRLLRDEGGLAWTAHPRIKSSTGFPDAYRDRLFFRSDRFLGAAWKAMPADLSQPRLGARVLDLLDDMSNWGGAKYVLGEVDVFKIEPDHELYAHMNVNYLRLAKDKIHRFDDGWQPVLDKLRGGEFFVTTGEVLIPDFTVNGERSGSSTSVEGDKARVRLKLKWTFPLAYAVIISGDGRTTKRQRIELSETGSFEEQTLEFEADVAGQRWLRVEIWDIATNGAFTQPVWLNSP